MSESATFMEAWKVIIGLMFVFVVLYLPRGLAGVAKDVLERILARRRGSSEAPAVAAGEFTPVVTATWPLTEAEHAVAAVVIERELHRPDADRQRQEADSHC